MAKLILDMVVYDALHMAFHDAPEGKRMNKHHVSVDLSDHDIRYIESEAREGETLSQTILRVSNEIRRVTQQKEAA